MVKLLNCYSVDNLVVVQMLFKQLNMLLKSSHPEETQRLRDLVGSRHIVF
jgi:hypothetical protein